MGHSRSAYHRQVYRTRCHAGNQNNNGQNVFIAIKPSERTRHLPEHHRPRRAHKDSKGHESTKSQPARSRPSEISRKYKAGHAVAQKRPPKRQSNRRDKHALHHVSHHIHANQYSIHPLDIAGYQPPKSHILYVGFQNSPSNRRPTSFMCRFHRIAHACFGIRRTCQLSA